MVSTEDIWHEYYTDLATFIKGRVPAETADDIMQDVFIKIHTKVGSLKEDTKLKSWLYQVTRNTIVDYYRLKRNTTDLPVWLKESQEDDLEMVRWRVASYTASLITRLPKIYQEAIRLSEIEGKNQSEVAKILGISLSGAKSRIQRGRSLLKSMLQDCCTIETNKAGQIISYTRNNSCYKSN